MYRIGEFSKLTSLSDKTLRFYESIGLLIPDEVDKWTNYRLYSDRNLQEAKEILEYKELGFSLKDIIKLKNELNVEIVDTQIDSLEEQRNIIDYQLYKLHILRDSIEQSQDNNISNEQTKLSKDSQCKILTINNDIKKAG